MESQTSHDDDNDADHLRTKVAQLEEEKRRMSDEFNAQRARMKEMFLQKESELKKLTQETSDLRRDLDDAKSQIAVAEFELESSLMEQDRKAQEEIASLQKLVYETIEESGHSKSSEIFRLKVELERMHSEANVLREELQNTSHHQDSTSLAPVLSHVKKTIARKLGANSSSSSADDYLEDSMRQAQEDAEVLRSLVVPLEEEIKALKEKLRTTDEELQRFQKASNIPANSVESAIVGLLTPTSPAIEKTPATQQKPSLMLEVPDNTTTTRPPSILGASTVCLDCPTHLVRIEKLNQDLAAAHQTSDRQSKDVDRLREEIDREASLRHDLEEQWQEKREMHKYEVQSLTERVATTERGFAELRQFYAAAKEQMRADVTRLTAEREQIERHLETLQNDNDFLAGRFGETADELQQQRIDLPATVDDLQVVLLSIHEALIEAKVGYEFEQRKSKSFYHETQLLYKKHQEYEKEAEAKIKAMENRIRHLQTERGKLIVLRETLERREMESEKQASDLRVQVIELHECNEKLAKHNADLKQKGSVLQQELANSETVQQDFVRLSQSLQMELEKIRAADTTVRWQDEDDIEQCPSCKSAFAVTRRKQHCRHCGTIYCERCITKTVTRSGQSSKPARVCDVCHTLLERNTAPYFSQAPPHSPT